MAVIEGYNYAADGKLITLHTALTAENTTTDVIKMIGSKEVMLTFVVTGNTAQIVVVRAEHSCDNTNWSNTDVDNQNTSFSGNGNFSLNVDYKTLGYIRANFVSETGSGAVITIYARVK